MKTIFLIHLAEQDSCRLFSYVVLSEVVEHVSDPESFISYAWHLARLAMVVTVPNIAY